MSELKQFRLPDVGEGLTEADIVTWRVEPGDQVHVNQVIVEIETAKSLVELPCPFEGVVSKLLVPSGETVDVGTPIIEVDVSAGAGDSAAGDSASEPGTVGGGAAGPAARPLDLIPAPPPQGATEPGIHGSPAPKAERQAVLVGYGVKLGTTARRPRKPTATSGSSAAPGPAGRAPAGTGTAAAAAAPAGAGAGQRSATETAPGAAGNGAAAAATARPAAKPPVRKLARDLGVDLAAVAGSGPGGSITRDDVRGALAQPPAVAAVGGEERIRITGVRKHTALAVAASAFTAPHVTEFLQVDVTETMHALRRLSAAPEFGGARLSPLLFAAKALLLAAARHPMINSSWDEGAQEIVVKHYVNLGIAAATSRGLIVPNVKNAHLLSLPALAQALNGLAATAREGKAQPADLSGGTITITNVGVFGVDTGTPILTPGEAAILALGQVKEAPWVHEGALAVRQVTTLALSFDHRIVDGDLGSAVLRDVGAMLTDPLRMLAWDGPPA